MGFVVPSLEEYRDPALLKKRLERQQRFHAWLFAAAGIIATLGIIVCVILGSIT